MRFVSHLDLMRIFQRALRRAGLPVAFTKGFSPHMKVSVTRALKLGLESLNEEAVIAMDAAVGAEEFIALMNEKLPVGIKVTGAKETA